MIPVVWLSLHPDTIAPRGYFDQGILEDLFSTRAFGIDPAVFDHLVIAGHDPFPPAERGILVLPARHHTSSADLRHLLSQLPRWHHPVVILTGDEESAFPISRLRSVSNIRIWVQTPSPAALSRVPSARRIGDGYPPGTRQMLPTHLPDKTLDWFFAGQITHSVRQAAHDAMTTLTQPGKLIATAGFTQGLGRHDYMSLFASARLAPSPGGPCTPDTFRFFEALEAGALPIADSRAYWSFLFGTTDLPFPCVDDWSELPDVAADALARWPADASRSSAFYQRHKRDMAIWLSSDIGHSILSPITVVIPTSPLRSHPDTSIIEQTVASVTQRLPDSEILICCDGVRSEQEDLREAYEEYLYRLMWLCNHRWTNAVPFIHDAHRHQSGMAHAALSHVRTPLLLYVEADCPLTGAIDFDSLAAAINSGQANVIRLHHEAFILEPHRHLMLDSEPIDVAGAPLLRTIQWSQRPHLASTAFYRWLMATYFGPEARTMIEDVIHGPIQVEYDVSGLAGWEKFRLHVYCPEHPYRGNIKRSWTVDGRGEEPKYPMHIIPPPDAPLPLGYPRTQL